MILAAPAPLPPRVEGLTQLHAHLFWRSREGLDVPDTQPLAFHIPLYADWMSGPPNAYTLLGGLIRVESRARSDSCPPTPTHAFRSTPDASAATVISKR